MSGDTHMAVGAGAAVLTSTLIFQDTSIITFAEYAVMGAVGGLILDIDVDSSKGAKIVNRLLIIAGIFAAILVLSLITGDTSLFDKLKTLDYELVCNFLSFAAMIIVGKASGHRTVTHSLEWITGVSAMVCRINLELGIAFLIGAVMHTLTDLLNAKDVTLSLIFKLKLCFKIVDAGDKKANQILQGIGVACCGIALIRILQLGVKL